MNDVLKTIENRVSLRRYADKKITKEDMDTILDHTLRAPSAGNMLLYSIIKVESEEKKKILSQTCDNQPFIAQAPTLLVFCADFQRWYDYYKLSGVYEESATRGLSVSTPAEGDLMLAIMDTMIASSFATLAAESLGIGSCYIGDIIENFEQHQELFGLPQWVVPISMLTLGYYPENYRRTMAPRFDKKFIVSNETYHQLTDVELTEMFASKEEGFRTKNKFDAKNFGQFNYFRKTGTEFTAEMTRSVRVMIEAWSKQHD